MALHPLPGPVEETRPSGLDRLSPEEPQQVVAQILCGRITAVAVLGDRLQCDRLQVLRNSRIDPAREGGLLVSDPVQDVLTILTRDRRGQREQLVERHAQRVDVGAVVDHDRLAHRLLGAHEPQGADQVTGAGQVAVFLHPGQAEIGHPQMARPVQEEIGRLDVAVDHSVSMGVVEGFRRLECQMRRGSIEVSGAFGGVRPDWQVHRRCDLGIGTGFTHGRRVGSMATPKLADHRGEARPLDELHGVVVLIAVGPHRVDRDDVRVIEQRGRSGFELEPGPLAAVGHRTVRQHLHGHPAPECDLFGLVHDRHSPAANLADQAIVAQDSLTTWTDMGRVGSRAPVRCGRRADRLAQVGHQRDRGEDFIELLSLLGILDAVSVEVDHLSGLEFIHQLLDQGVERRVRGAAGGEISGSGLHRPSPFRSASSSSRSRPRARVCRVEAAPFEMPSASAVSANESRSR